MYSEIFKLRDCGFLKISTVTLWKEPFSAVLKNLGLSENAKHLREIDIELAQEIVSKILWKDLAYGSELMSEGKASSFAGRIIEDYVNDDCVIYTNGTWERGELKGWNPMTGSTFDSGVIIKHPDYCSCIWVEDED